MERGDFSVRGSERDDRFSRISNMSYFRKYIHMVKCNLYSIQSHQSLPYWNPNISFLYKRLILIILETILNIMFLVSGLNLAIGGLIFKE